MRLMIPRHSTVVAYLALFVALGGGAYAVAHAPSSMRITACYSKRSGDLRILTGSHCKRGERKLVWNRQGPPGPATGPAGGALTGTYPSPQLADGAVTSAKFATGAQAPDSAELGGQPASAYAPASLLGSPGPFLTTNGSSDTACFLTEVRLMAGNETPPNWHLADGTQLPIASNVTLYQLLGTTYGGNGTTTFALPDLRAADPKGASPAGVNYYICTSGTFP